MMSACNPRRGELIDVSDHKPRRIPSKKWPELIKKVWEADPLLCPKCHKEIRIVALMDDKTAFIRPPEREPAALIRLGVIASFQ